MLTAFAISILLANVGAWQAMHEDREMTSLANLFFQLNLRPPHRPTAGTSQSAVIPPVGSLSSRRGNLVLTAALLDDIHPFPDRVLDNIARYLVLENCSYVDLPLDVGQRIMDSDFFQAALAHPLSRFEVRRQGLRRSPRSAEEGMLLALQAFFDPTLDFEDELELDDEEKQLKKDKDLELKPGLGMYMLEWEGETLFVVAYEKEQEKGRGIAIFVQGQGRRSHLQTFCNLPEFKPKGVEDKVDVFVGRIHPNSGEFSWEQSEATNGRSFESVLLPESVKNAIDNDLSSFLSEGRLALFRRHGIPYKRSYLFQGIPGAGKTSMIRALATKFNRRLCILQPSGSAWNDYLLYKAVESAPSRAMIIFEDADTLFSEIRENTAQSGVTFSGFLNVLDGVSCRDGSIFVLTTNYRERLDGALTRDGRVDLEIPFGYIQPAEVIGMFRQFYAQDQTEENDLKAVAFEAALHEALGPERYALLTPAALQLYFVRQLDSSPDEAIRNLGQLRHQIDR